TANIVLGALYATGLRIVDIRLAVPIGVVTGMLAFVPYIGFFTGLFFALAMATLDWHGFGSIVGVFLVMGGVQLLDAFIITARIALTRTVIGELRAAFDAANDDVEVRCVVLTGAGGHFCAGADLRRAWMEDPQLMDHIEDYMDEFHAVVRALVRCTKPTVAML